MARRRLITVIDRLIALDLLKTIVSVLVVIVAILVSKKFISILGQAVKGQISSDTVLTIMGLKTISIAVSFLPVAVFVAVIMVLGRMYRDQEMSALSSAGMGIGVLYRAVLLCVLPLSLVTSWWVMITAPWAEVTIQQLIQEDSKSADLRGVSAGRFSEYSQGDVVFYVQEIAADGRLQNVFVHTMDHGTSGVISADSGEIRDLPGGRYIVLMHGERIQGGPGEVNFINEYFTEYALRLEEKGIAVKQDRWSVPTSRLWQSDDLRDIAELQRRLAIPLGILVLSALAVPLAQISPRGGVYGNILTAFGIYFCYANLQKATQSWVANGDVPVGFGYFWIYGLMLLIIALLVGKYYGGRWLFMHMTGRWSA